MVAAEEAAAGDWRRRREERESDEEEEDTTGNGGDKWKQLSPATEKEYDVTKSDGHVIATCVDVAASFFLLHCTVVAFANSYCDRKFGIVLNKHCEFVFRKEWQQQQQ